MGQSTEKEFYFGYKESIVGTHGRGTLAVGNSDGACLWFAYKALYLYRVSSSSQQLREAGKVIYSLCMEEAPRG